MQKKKKKNGVGHWDHECPYPYGTKNYMLDAKCAQLTWKYTYQPTEYGRNFVFKIKIYNKISSFYYQYKSLVIQN